MKKLLFTFFSCCAIFISGHAQDMEGTFTNTWESNAGGALTYTITLNPDGTFEFVSHRDYETSIPSKTITAEGTWRHRNRLLILATETTSESSDLLKNLNKNKARFKTYSPRHRKYGKVKPNLRFYRSKVFYAKGMKLFEKETDSTVTGTGGF